MIKHIVNQVLILLLEAFLFKDVDFMTFFAAQLVLKE